jgi:hypothetical protein
MIPAVLNGAKQVVEVVRAQIAVSRNTHIWQGYPNSLKMISQVVFTGSLGFLLESIQISEDAGLGLDKHGEFTIALGGKSWRDSRCNLLPPWLLSTGPCSERAYRAAERYMTAAFQGVGRRL